VTIRNLVQVFEPKSVAVLGASNWRVPSALSYSPIHWRGDSKAMSGRWTRNIKSWTVAAVTRPSKTYPAYQILPPSWRRQRRCQACLQPFLFLFSIGYVEPWRIFGRVRMGL